MDGMALLEGLALGSALIIAIGPQNAFVLRQGLAGRHVFAVATVCFLSDVLLIAIGAAGVGTAIRAYPQILETVAWLGCLFLLGFALRSFYRAYRVQEVMDAAGGVHGALGTAVATALMLTFLNPHVYLDTVLVLGGIASRFAGWDRALFALGAMLASALWFYPLGFGARKLRRFLARANTWRVIDGAIGVVMLALAISLARPVLTGDL